MPGEVLMAARGITGGYEEDPVLENVSMEVRCGEVLVIVAGRAAERAPS
jgi:ABC-type transporter Mla maintaining outer membrane lipid asymmetry ATPase subunit MlaF